MLKSIESWAIERLTRKAVDDLASIPNYQVIDEKDIHKRMISGGLNGLVELIISLGFQKLGVLHHANLRGRLRRDIFQMIFLSESGETICCLGLMTIAGQEVPYIEFISELDSGKVVINVVIKEITRKEATDNIEHKFHRVVIRYDLDIKGFYSDHIRITTEMLGERHKLQKFSHIEDGVYLSRKMFLGDLVFTLISISKGRENISIWYRMLIGENGFERLKANLNQAIIDAQIRLNGLTRK